MKVPSAEKILMIGIGAIGVYAVYRLVTAPKDQSPLPETAARSAVRAS